MADTNPLDILNTDPEVLGLQRQRQLANLLTGQAFNQPQGQMISGHYVKPSGLQQALPMINAAIGGLTNANLDTKQQALAEALRGKKVQIQQSIMDKINSGDTKGALEIASQNTEYGGKDFVAPLLGNVIPKAEGPTPEMQNYKYAQTPEGGGFKGSFNEFKNQMTPYQAEELRLKKIQLANEQGGGKLSEFQGKATNFGVQMAGSTKEMAAVEKSGFDPTSTKNQVLLSAAGTGLGNYIVPPEVQRYKQAMDNFTENYIRFKSGANVPMHEIEGDLKNMMPQPGDGVDKLEQKQRARERALQGMAISAGPGARFISQAYNTEAPGMKNEAPTQPSTNGATPSLWGPATVVNK